MSYGENFRSAFAQHQESLKALENTLNELNVDALTEENIRLTEERDQLKADMKALQQTSQQLSSELSSVRSAYREQILNEKLNQLTLSKSRLNLLFGGASKGALNRLQGIEAGLTQRMKRMIAQTDKLQDEIKEKYTADITRLQNQMDHDIAELRRQMAAASQQASSILDEQYSDSNLSEVDDALLKRLQKGNNVEIKLGLNLINKLGVILIFLAVILAGRYTYAHWFNDYAKGITFYVLGLIFCGAGEWLHRKRMPAVAAGLTGGGIGLFYASTFICTFYLNILSFNMAMAVSLLIALASLTLTLRYKSATIGMLSLVGGYLPFFTYVVVQGIDALPLLEALAYLMVYNAVVLGISLRHKWNLIIYAGFLFNMPCVHYLLTRMDNEPLAIAFAYGNFLIYLVVVLYRNLKDREPLNGADLALVGLNTLTNCSMVYYLFNRAGYGDYNGLLAIFYAVIYFGLAALVDRQQGNRSMVNTFYTFAVGFSILVVPLQLTEEWMFFGWLIEMCLYVYLGRLYRNKPLEYMGNGLVVLSHLAFVMYNDVSLLTDRAYPALVDFKYAALVASEVFLVWVYWHLGRTRPDERVPQLAVSARYPIAAHISLYAAYEALSAYHSLMKPFLYEGLEVLILFWGAFVLCNQLYRRLKIERYMNLRMYTTVSEVIVYSLLIGINFLSFETEGHRWWLDTALLIGGNSAVLWRMNGFLKELQAANRLPREVRAVILGGYTLVAYFINLTGTYRPVNLSVVLNISLILFSLLYITIGFRNRFIMLRRMGLGLSLLCTVKMLIIDSLSFSLIQKIGSYFVFGLVLIAISFVYQRITGLMDKDGQEVKP